MGQNQSNKQISSYQAYNEGECKGANMCKNYDKKMKSYTSPNAYCKNKKCICGQGYEQLDGRCCKDVILDKKKGKYVCVKHEKQICPNDHTCKNFDFNKMQFTCPDAKCTKNGCNCGSCKNFEGTCCKDVIFDKDTKQYKCVELSGYGYDDNDSNVTPVIKYDPNDLDVVYHNMGLPFAYEKTEYFSPYYG